MDLSKPLVFGLRQQIADKLRIEVLCGRLAEGTKVSEAKMAQQFGVSRTPIREALQQLSYEGLLESRPNAGVTVAQRPPDAIRELVVPIRRSVEVFALRTIFDSLTEEDFIEWNQILNSMKGACAAKDYSSIAEHDIALHRSIVRRAALPDLEAIWMPIVARMRSHFLDRQSQDYSDPMSIYEEHVRMIEAFRGNEIEIAVNAIEQNIA